ncbi:MurR/RpiR family transcriptional regulator [Halobacillus karajensis]|uniref:MurR/RpiR family transcriptional regulator n=1 Tax=Halobacillus karajensis TaxID=195088 RepID=UPI001428CFAF|nr:MurR/RpiR family transcriptional regulator [Halobacillus karajensis]
MSNPTKKHIQKNIIDIKEELPKKQKQVCDYLVEHYDSIETYTLSDLSHKADVGVSTIMRVVKALGFESYLELRKAIHKEVVATRATWWHMQKSFEDNQKEHILTDVWSEITKLLEQTITKSLMYEFDQAVELMVQSEKISVLGLRTSKAPAVYFGHLMEEFYPHIIQLSHESDFIYDRASRLTEKDTLVLVANAPYTIQSVEVAKFLHERGVSIILITDLPSCPAASYSSIVLNTKSSKNQYTILPAIALLESLVIEFGRNKSDTSISHLDELGKVLRERNITSS